MIEYLSKSEVAILRAVSEKKMTTKEISESISISMANVYQSTRVLALVGMICKSHGYIGTTTKGNKELQKL